jgi:multicomponent Na+:H+ antiporter subunit E
MEERETTGERAEGNRGPGMNPEPPPVRTWGRTLALAAILSLFWILLSGRIGLQYFLFMAVAVVVVLILNPVRAFDGATAEPSRGMGLRGRLRAGGYLLRYLVWLVVKVIRANVEVAILILHPRLPIRPRFLTFRTTLRHPMAKALVANSITLTPGTVTVDLDGGEYLVHALVPESAGAVTGGELQNVVAPIFGEGPDPVPQVRWSSSYRELGT